MNDAPDIATWAESPAGFYLAETKRPIVLAEHQRAILCHVFTPGADGRLPYETILWSAPKKSGKTTTAALATLYFSLFFEPPNEVYTAANDLEQNQGRVFADVGRAIRANPILSRRSGVLSRSIHLDNGTVITALSSDYAGAAGSRHGLTTWDELWGYASESSRRLWDELTPVPTRHNSCRFIVTYAGYEGESLLLEELYKSGLAGDVVPELAHIENGRGEPACRARGRYFCYWDHELKPHAGLTVTPADYHEQQRRDLRPAAFARLHLNEWATSISAFVTAEQWAACYDPGLAALSEGDGQRLFFGADASTSRDFTALVGVTRGRDKVARVAYVKVWKPQASALRGGKATIDLSATIEADILRLWQAGHVGSFRDGKEDRAAIAFDPYQLHSIATNLAKQGLVMVELPQTAQRVAADQALYDAIIGRTLRHYGHPELSQAIANAVAVETPRGFRLAKEKTSRKIDAAVALSMAHSLAIQAAAHFPLPASQPTMPSRWRAFEGAGAADAAGSVWRKY